MRRALSACLVSVVILGALAYLRDPPWLAAVESGFRSSETSTDGTRYRWTSGHASFFVPDTATAIAVPARTTFDTPGDPSVLVTISIDDRTADEFVLRDDGWHTRTLSMPPPGRRRHRRIDVRVDRVRDGNRGVQLGEITVLR